MLMQMLCPEIPYHQWALRRSKLLEVNAIELGWARSSGPVVQALIVGSDEESVLTLSEEQCGFSTHD